MSDTTNNTAELTVHCEINDINASTPQPPVERKTKLNEDILAYIDLSVQKMKEAASGYNHNNNNTLQRQHVAPKQPQQPRSFSPEVYGHFNEQVETY